MKRRLLRLLFFVIALYALSCAVLFTMQRSLLYLPRPLIAEPDAPRVSIPAKGGTLHGWIVNPGRPNALVYFGGNGERVENDVDFFHWTLPEWSVYLVPYRGYGPNSGQPTESGIESDALAVEDFVRTHHAHVALMGRSLGTGVATFVAAARHIDKLVLVTPYDSILNIARERYSIFPVALFLKDRYESWRHASAIKAPVLILLAQHDSVVPSANSDALIDRFPTRPTVIVIPRAGHNNLSNNPRYARALVNFLREAALSPVLSQHRQREPSRPAPPALPH